MVSAEDEDLAVNQDLGGLIWGKDVFDSFMRIANLEGRSVDPFGDQLTVLVGCTNAPSIGTELLQSSGKGRIVIKGRSFCHGLAVIIDADTEIGR